MTKNELKLTDSMNRVECLAMEKLFFRQLIQSNHLQVDEYSSAQSNLHF